MFIIKDVLLRMNLKIQNARGQCYDGAATMAGKRKGVQHAQLSNVWRKRPLIIIKIIQQMFVGWIYIYLDVVQIRYIILDKIYKPISQSYTQFISLTNADLLIRTSVVLLSSSLGFAFESSTFPALFDFSSSILQ